MNATLIRILRVVDRVFQFAEDACNVLHGVPRDAIQKAIRNLES